MFAFVSECECEYASVYARESVCYTFRLSLFLISFRTCCFLRCTPYYAASNVFFFLFVLFFFLIEKGNAFACTHFSLCSVVKFNFASFFLLRFLFASFYCLCSFLSVSAFVYVSKDFVRYTSTGTVVHTAVSSRFEMPSLACFVLYLVYMLAYRCFKNDYFIP